MTARYPPGPANFNFWCGGTWRHAWRQLADPLGFATELATYGDLAFYRLFTYQAYQVNHPDLVREVLVTKADKFQKQRRQRELIERVAGPGILTTEGLEWVRKRRMLLPAFQSRIGRSMAEAAVSQSRQLTDTWRAGQEIDLYRAMTGLMVRTVGQSFFGHQSADETDALARALHDLADCFLDTDYSLVRLSGWFPWLNRARLRSAEAEIARYFAEACARQRRAAARESGGRENGDRDLLGLLLAGASGDGQAPPLTDAEVLAEARTMFFAGHHTAAACLTWTLHLLALHPRIRQRLVDEIREVLDDREATIADIPKLPYTTQVLHESMRLYPPAWALFAREALEPVEIGSYTIPRGAWVFIYPWVLHRNARVFPDPLTFNPDRFSPGAREAIPDGAYIPFGLGPHSCIGGRIAMTALQVALPTLLQRFTFDLAPNQPPVELATAISLRPKRDIRMRLEPASQAPQAPLSRGLGWGLAVQHS
jgi:cytochrome P450